MSDEYLVQPRDLRDRLRHIAAAYRVARWKGATRRAAAAYAARRRGRYFA